MQDKHGKRVLAVGFSWGLVEPKTGQYMVFEYSYHGDRDEFWVVLYNKYEELERYNVRYIEGITWE